MRQVDFADCLFFTHAVEAASLPDIRVISVERFLSAKDYSEFLLRGLVRHVRTEHCLIVQWDGFVLDAAQWDPRFLEFDYIGASWPQFRDGHDVGNGGFSLRSRRLLEACLDPRFSGGHPEDVTICRENRRFLEESHGIRFADCSTADRFSFERAIPAGSTFGFHGVFNMIPALDTQRFWELYRSLDDRTTAFRDYRRLMGQLGRGPQRLAKRRRLTMDFLMNLLRRSRA